MPFVLGTACIAAMAVLLWVACNFQDVYKRQQLGSLGQHGAKKLGEEELLRVSVYKGLSLIHILPAVYRGITRSGRGPAQW